ncbi:hypothetical protein HBI23_049030 [Parastagonospora nodorum]|nr:hypothetical protein HBI12_029650 [Parastagonospora nodorum]KAH5685811.1 hypothetical protein HBI23_049030 [Parastagonospora nodorum]
MFYGSPVRNRRKGRQVVKWARPESSESNAKSSVICTRGPSTVKDKETIKRVWFSLDGIKCVHEVYVWMPLCRVSQVHGLGGEASDDSEDGGRDARVRGFGWNRWLIDRASNVCSKKLGGVRCRSGEMM